MVLQTFKDLLYSTPHRYTYWYTELHKGIEKNVIKTYPNQLNNPGNRFSDLKNGINHTPHVYLYVENNIIMQLLY